MRRIRERLQLVILGSCHSISFSCAMRYCIPSHLLTNEDHLGVLEILLMNYSLFYDQNVILSSPTAIVLTQPFCVLVITILKTSI